MELDFGSINNSCSWPHRARQCYTMLGAGLQSEKDRARHRHPAPRWGRIEEAWWDSVVHFLEDFEPQEK